MENFTAGALEIKMEKDTDKATMSWVGKSEDRNPAAILNSYLDKLVEELKGGDLIMEFRSFEYMNSSTVPPIIHFIKNLDTNGVKTVIVYDKNSKWQSASFKALETISMTMKNISVEGQ